MNERFWKRAGTWTALRLNVASWLAAFLPAALGASLVLAAALLLLRRNGVSLHAAWVCYGLALTLCAAGALGFAWRKFFRQHDALVRLDSVLHLHNRLTAAAAGVGAWPTARAAVNDGFRWDWPRVLGPPALALTMIVTAFWIPLSRNQGTHSIEAPQAWTQLESWIEHLAEAGLVEEPSLEKLREQIAELKKQAPENWYSHSSLEATDTLRQETEQSLKALDRELQTSAAALSALEKLGDGMTAGELKAMSDALEKSSRAMELGHLPLSRELLEKLKNLDPNSLKKLTPEQIAQLRKQLQQGAKICENCLGSGSGQGNKDLDALLALINGAGSGGPGGGGGPARLSLKERPTDLHGKESESVSNEDLSRALPGDVMGVSKGEHEVNKNQFTGPVAAGQISSPGTGGEAVWRDTLIPQEREVLQRFYK